MPFAIGITVGRCRARRQRVWVFGKTTSSSGRLCLLGAQTAILPGEYKLKMTECAELCRVALAKHSTPVSRILSIAVKMLKREMPGIRLIVSYADLNHGHFGKIYQASNWIFVGETGHEAGIVLNGKLTHRRTINSKYGTSTIEWLHEHVDSCARRVEGKPKFKYLLPLDDEIAERIKLLAKAYPKIRATSETSDTPGVHPGEGRAARTVALQSLITPD